MDTTIEVCHVEFKLHNQSRDGWSPTAENVKQITDQIDSIIRSGYGECLGTTVCIQSAGYYWLGTEEMFSWN